jgi:CRISPR/Cas system-associated protein endoribonuclease Cas2
MTVAGKSPYSKAADGTLQKVCSRCGRMLSVEHFHRHRHSRYVAACKDCMKAARANATRREQMRRASRRGQLRRYGLTEEQYQEMLIAQGGRCKICGTADRLEKNQLLCVDHDHCTGAVRGFLCGNCNRMLGAARDQPEVLFGAAIYLETSLQQERKP